MATVSDLLDLMSLIDNELEIGAGESDESQAIKALIQAQHHFELIAASKPRILQDTVNIVTANVTEKTTWSSLLRRVDALWYLDATGNPIRALERIDEIGGHVPSLPWPLQIALGSAAGGAPFGYYGNMRDFYWLPRPDGVYTIRVYGFIKKAAFAVRGDAYNYPDETMLALASFANKLMSVGVADDTLDLDRLTAQVFAPLIKSYTKFDRSKPSGRVYTMFHST